MSLKSEEFCAVIKACAHTQDAETLREVRAVIAAADLTTEERAEIAAAFAAAERPTCARCSRPAEVDSLFCNGHEDKDFYNREDA